MRALVAMALLAGAALSTHAQDSAQPEQLANRFIAAWNAHDAVAFGKLFAADADWVTASGQRLQGRERIRAYLGEEHAGWAKGTRMQASNIHVRRRDDDSATVFFEWEISEAGKPPRSGNNVLVAERSANHWRIVAGQVARKPPP
jgi:uncharacterized protein (TIGR02246 family)